MDIVFGINNDFVMPCGVFMLSILKTNKETEIRFHIITEWISDENKILLNTNIQGYKCKIRFYEIKDNVSIMFLNLEHWGIANYYRLFAPSLLPNNIAKILYLDCDMLCIDSLKELWDTDISNEAVAVSTNRNSDNFVFTKRLGYDLRDGHIYFNAGMMLINLDYWRKNDVAEKTIKFIQKYSENGNQPALNYITLNTRKRVAFRFNVCVFGHEVIIPPPEKMPVRKEYEDEIREGLKNPAIIHFVGPCKPWHEESKTPYTEAWCFMKEQTVWKHEQLKSMNKTETFSKRSKNPSFIKRAIKFVLPYGLLKIYRHLKNNKVVKSKTST